MEPVKLPTRADDPPRLLLWSADECLPILIGFCLGITVHQIFLCTFVGYILSKFYSRFRDLHADGLAFHYLYHIGMYPSKVKSMVNPFIKIFFP